MFIKSQFRRSAGFTLTELTIALVINALVFTSLLAIFIANINHYTQTINTNRLNQQLEATVELMATDIRRAGYWANANTNIGTDTNTNPFMSTSNGTDVSIGPGNTCILLTYDHNNTGVLPAISAASDDDRYGYRLNGNTIQSRPWGAPFSCTASATSWENVTDSTIVNITALTFTLNSQTVTTGPGSAGLLMRSVDISITGQLVSNPAITKTVTQHVRIRNDKFIP
jgi:type II secretory pathway component PulJ